MVSKSIIVLIVQSMSIKLDIAVVIYIYSHLSDLIIGKGIYMNIE